MLHDIEYACGERDGGGETQTHTHDQVCFTHFQGTMTKPIESLVRHIHRNHTHTHTHTHATKPIESLVGHIDASLVGLDGAERKVLSRD